MSSIPHDHPTVGTVDGVLRSRGPTDRPRVVFPTDAADQFEGDAVVALVLDGERYHCRIADGRSGPEARGAFDTPAQARTPGDGTNHLPEWVDERGLAYGRTIHCDVIEPGERYGLRAPGERATYADPGSPKQSLQEIADGLTDGN